MPARRSAIGSDGNALPARARGGSGPRFWLLRGIRAGLGFDRFRALILLAAFTGLRYGERAALARRYIDPDALP